MQFGPGENPHHHWQSMLDKVKRVAKVVDVICLVIGSLGFVSLMFNFWEFKRGNKRHTEECRETSISVEILENSNRKLLMLCTIKKHTEC